MVVDRRSRTCAPNARAAVQPVENGLRLLSKVLRQVARSRPFTSYTDLRDAFREQLRTLRIRYAQCEFDDAFSVVGSNLRLVDLAPAPRRSFVEPESRGFSRSEAAAFMAQLPGLVKAMPPAMGKRA